MSNPSEKIIDLNVGGILVSATKATLCLLEGSKLAQFFADDKNPEFLRDKNGRVFLDYDPTLFIPLLDYLRRRKINGATDPPSIPAEKQALFDELLIYLGVQSYLWSPGNKFDRVLKSQTIELPLDGKLSSGAGGVIGVDKYLNSLVYVKFRVEHAAGKKCPLYLGVISHQDIQYMGPVDPKMAQLQGCYVCRPEKCVAALYGESYITMSGTLPSFFSSPLPIMPVLPRKFDSGTEIEMVLNCKRANILRISDNQKDTYGVKENNYLPPDYLWRFFAMVMDPQVSLHFIDCTRIIALVEDEG
eukprot:TRINITY_DN1438_c0_g2_i1.p2 TRINITY_DN1438_c0_g2~~TRINITY_DN1438_c0_g2_i1.p2  ORF type:complete len:302 (-),score=36.29 TRINITY_DN1438_c0_g2_i1:1093-1998(-)